MYRENSINAERIKISYTLLEKENISFLQ